MNTDISNANGGPKLTLDHVWLRVGFKIKQKVSQTDDSVMYYYNVSLFGLIDTSPGFTAWLEYLAPRCLSTLIKIEVGPDRGVSYPSFIY